jgi:hypothetical protein
LVIVFTAIFILFIAAILPGQKAKMDTYAGDAGIIDLSFFPSPDQVYNIAEVYGEDGRRKYIATRVSLDIVWPLAYTFFMVSVITFFLRRVHGSDSRLVHFNLSAVAVLVLDFIENGLAVIVMSAYPDRFDGIVYIMATATATKWIMMGIASLAMLYGIVALPIVLIKRR